MNLKISGEGKIESYTGEDIMDDENDSINGAYLNDKTKEATLLAVEDGSGYSFTIHVQ